MPRADALAPCGWGLVALAAGALVAPLEPNLLEEGIVVHAAERIAGGEHLFRDVWVHTGPLPYELLALLFRLFGPELEAARVAILGLQGLGTAALFAAARRAGVGAWAHAAAAVVAAAPLFFFPLYSTFFYSTIVSYLSLVAAYLALRALDSTAWAVATGVLVALIALSKQSTGVWLAVGLLAGLVAGAAPGARAARALAYAAGGGGMALATLALYAARGDLEALLFGQIELPVLLGAGSSFQMPFVNLWPPGQLDPFVFKNWVMYLPYLYYLRYGLYETLGSGMILFTQLLYSLPFAVLLASGLRLLPVFGRAHPLVWLHGAVALAMAMNLFPRSDWGHLVVALPPALVQLLLLPAGAARRRGRGPAARAASVLLVVGLLGFGLLLGAWLRAISGPPSFGPRVPLRPVSTGYRTPAVPRVIEYLRRRVEPGDAIFVARQEPLLYFATGTRNPTPFPGVLPGIPDLQQPTILRALETLRFVVMSDIDQAIHAFYARELPEVYAHLERHFEIPADFPVDYDSWILVLERSRDRGATAVDLLEEAPRARAWIRDAEGRQRPVAGSPPQLKVRQLRRPLAVPLGEGGGGLDFELRIPERAVFQAGVGYAFASSDERQYTHPAATTAVLSVAEGGDFVELASVAIDQPSARWLPLEADLGRYAGQTVALRVEIRARGSGRIDFRRFAWWGSPRIALRAADP